MHACESGKLSRSHPTAAYNCYARLIRSPSFSGNSICCGVCLTCITRASVNYRQGVRRPWTICLQRLLGSECVDKDIGVVLQRLLGSKCMGKDIGLVRQRLLGSECVGKDNGVVLQWHWTGVCKDTGPGAPQSREVNSRMRAQGENLT